MKHFTKLLLGLIMSVSCMSLYAADDNAIVTEKPEGREVFYGKSALSYKTVSTYYSWYNIEGGIGHVVYSDDNETVWIKSPFMCYPLDCWIKGTIEGGKITIHTPQPVYQVESYGEVYSYDLRRMVYDAGTNRYVCDSQSSDIVFEITDNGFVMSEKNVMMGLAMGDYWAGFGDVNVEYSLVEDTPVSAPEELESGNWIFTYGDYSNNTHKVKGGFVGDDLYLSGIVKDMPDAWIKGTLEEDSVVFKSGQYLGADYNQGFYLYFTAAQPYGYEYKQLDEIKFKYDVVTNEVTGANTVVLTGKEGVSMVANGGNGDMYVVYEYTKPSLRFDPNPAGSASPTDPYFKYYSPFSTDTGFGLVSFSIPDTDVNGTQLDTDKIFYNLYFDDDIVTFYPDEYHMLADEMTDVPYNYSDGYDFFVSGNTHTLYIFSIGFSRIGVQSIYRDEDEGIEQRSALVYYEDETGIKGLDADTAGTVMYHDMQGRRLEKPSKGLVLKTVTMPDGSCRTLKHVVR